MYSRDATEGSDSPKTRSPKLNSLAKIFTYDGNGSLKDRLLTALYVLVGALLLTIAAFNIPYGGFITVAFTTSLVAMATFEVARLFARHSETTAYRPVHGVILYAIMALPAVAAALSAVYGVLDGAISWRSIYAATAVSGELLMAAMVLEGRNSLDAAGRFAARYGVGFLIISICAPALIVISGISNGIALLWWIIGCAALNDSAAYFVGRAVGSHKLAPALSPNKSIEGSIAGLVVGTIAGTLLWRVLVCESTSMSSVVLVSLSVTLAAQMGDLAKSYMKRLRGVKDLGAIFPGHGGVLDRFDAMIAAAPVVLVSLLLLDLVK